MIPVKSPNPFYFSETVSVGITQANSGDGTHPNMKGNLWETLKSIMIPQRTFCSLQN